MAVFTVIEIGRRSFPLRRDGLWKGIEKKKKKYTPSEKGFVGIHPQPRSARENIFEDSRKLFWQFRPETRFSW